MSANLRDSILEADDLDVVECDVPEWGVVLHLRTPTAGGRGKMMGLWMKADGNESMIASTLYPLMIVLTAHDPATGEPVFGDDDVEFLAQKNGSVVERVALEAMKVAGMTGEAVEVGKDD